MKSPIYFITLLFCMSSLLSCQGCSPGYIIRGAYEQTKILLAREPIDEVLSDPNLSPDESEKLKVVLKAREYAILIGLDPKESFTTYSPFEGDAVSYVVSASFEDRFEIYTWWFPIVGSVPYKGFFDKEDAVTEATRLESEGYETWLRGTDAFSTLGWFNDPILSTTLRHDAVRIANTVIHESLHTTLWIPGSVDFNESLANFVGNEATVSMFESSLALCDAQDADCKAKNVKFIDLAKSYKEREYAFASIFEKLYQSLDQLYKSNRSREEKLKERNVIFNETVAPLRTRYPNNLPLEDVNNAKIMQLRLYLSNLDQFSRVFDGCGRDWVAFLKKMKDIQRQAEENSDTKPFELLKAL